MQWSLYIPLWPILILVQIPGDARWFTVLDLNDGCLLLHPSSSLISVSCLLLSGLTPTWPNAIIYLDAAASGVLGQPTLVHPGPENK